MAKLVKTIPEPSNDDHKRVRYKQMQKSARKDVERLFGVLKKMGFNSQSRTSDEKIKNYEYDVYMHHIILYGLKR